MVLVRNGTHRFVYLNVGSPNGGSVLGSYSTIKRYMVFGGCMSLRVGFEGLQPDNTFCFSLPYIALSCM